MRARATGAYATRPRQRAKNYSIHESQYWRHTRSLATGICIVAIGTQSHNLAKYSLLCKCLLLTDGNSECSDWEAVTDKVNEEIIRPVIVSETYDDSDWKGDYWKRKEGFEGEP